jgi:hypothetical protein
LGISPADDAFVKDVAALGSTVVQELASGNDVVLLAHSYRGIPLTEALIKIQGSVDGKAMYSESFLSQQWYQKRARIWPQR